MKSCFFRLLIPPLLTQLKWACPSARLDKKNQFTHLLKIKKPANFMMIIPLLECSSTANSPR